MELYDSLILGFGTALTPTNILFCFIGVVLGTLIGVLPGIGPHATIAMLLPVTITLEPTTALIMLAGIYYGAQYGGSTTAILINLPGEAASAVTALDGYQMAKDGRAGSALAVAALASPTTLDAPKAAPRRHNDLCLSAGVGRKGQRRITRAVMRFVARCRRAFGRRGFRPGPARLGAASLEESATFDPPTSRCPRRTVVERTQWAARATPTGGEPGGLCGSESASGKPGAAAAQQPP